MLSLSLLRAAQPFYVWQEVNSNHNILLVITLKLRNFSSSWKVSSICKLPFCLQEKEIVDETFDFLMPIFSTTIFAAATATLRMKMLMENHMISSGRRSYRFRQRRKSKFEKKCHLTFNLLVAQRLPRLLLTSIEVRSKRLITFPVRSTGTCKLEIILTRKKSTGRHCPVVQPLEMSAESNTLDTEMPLRIPTETGRAFSVDNSVLRNTVSQPRNRTTKFINFNTTLLKSFQPQQIFSCDTLYPASKTFQILCYLTRACRCLRLKIHRNR